MLIKNIFSGVVSFFQQDLRETSKLFWSKKRNKSWLGAMEAKEVSHGFKVEKNYLLGLCLLFFAFGFLFNFIFVQASLGRLGQIFPWVRQEMLSLSKNNDMGLISLDSVDIDQPDYQAQTSQEEAVITVVKKASPAVVSILITKEEKVLEQYFDSGDSQVFENEGAPFKIEVQIPKYRENGVEKKVIGGGSGFLVSIDGMVLTNKHVVADEKAEYTVVLSSGEKFLAKVLALDPLQDLALLKIESKQEVGGQGVVSPRIFPTLKLGDSGKLQIGQTVITIGNALNQFSNTVSVGVISGMARNLSATDGANTEFLEDVLQTDAAINKGNSGGPLLNLKGEVIGINVAMAEAAQSIGFSIPINKAKRDIEQVKKQGKIVYPFLGIVYQLIDEELQTKKNLPVSQGAWIPIEPGKDSILKDSAAGKAGLKEGDVVTMVNGEVITQDNTLSAIIKRYFPEDKVVLKVLRDGKAMDIEVILGQITSDDKLDN